ncbi:Membrane protein, putative [Shewanella piezotolerans WP3]|uniref:Membrane protein, putative n=1 Tax=Shewanella piezotolerans (strain WP3 / JCM 13877) TaxID=225849 RepID=B8CU10_SHEPW|nr:OB-fold-containig protein [Shewanella piezotolerans]ACJ30866.1 Membrane protein, putative [Shewanella piezotolerans WP3]
MVSFLLSQENLPYVISLCIVGILGIVESLSLVIGASFLGLLDDWAPNDAGNDVGGVTGLAGWLCISRLPLLIWFVLALVSFAIAGLSVNYFSLSWFNSLLTQSVSLPISLMLMALSCHFLGGRLASILPKNESSAVSVEDLNGCVGTLTIGKAVLGNPSEALVKDDYMQKHYVLVEPDEDGVEFLTGTQVVLLKRKGRVWSAAKLKS